MRLKNEQLETLASLGEEGILKPPEVDYLAKFSEHIPRLGETLDEIRQGLLRQSYIRKHLPKRGQRYDAQVLASYSGLTRAQVNTILRFFYNEPQKVREVLDAARRDPERFRVIINRLKAKRTPVSDLKKAVWPKRRPRRGPR